MKYLNPFYQRESWQFSFLKSLFQDEEFWGFCECHYIDGHVYYGSERNDDGPQRYLLRHNVSKDFEAFESWERFDTSEILNQPGAFCSFGSTESHVYYPGFKRGDIHNTESFGLVLRYRIGTDFKNKNNWDVFDASYINKDLGGFAGAINIGGKMIFVPYYSGGKEDQNLSLFLQYDCSKHFHDKSAWSTFNSTDLHDGLKGYYGGELDYPFCYFAPCYNDYRKNTNSFVLKYDVRKKFSDINSWSYIELTSLMSNPLLGGFHGSTAKCGNYIYFSPCYRPLPNTTADRHHGLVLRYNVKKPFSQSDSWEVFNSMTVRNDLCGFSGCISDGRYVYFNPTRCCSENLSGLMMRYDSQKDFDNPASYEVIDLAGWNPKFVFFDGSPAFDGENVYLCSASHHNVMAKFRTQDFEGCVSMGHKKEKRGILGAFLKGG